MTGNVKPIGKKLQYFIGLVILACVGIFGYANHSNADEATTVTSEVAVESKPIVGPDSVRLPTEEELAAHAERNPVKPAEPIVVKVELDTCTANTGEETSWFDAATNAATAMGCRIDRWVFGDGTEETSVQLNNPQSPETAADVPVAS